MEFYISNRDFIKNLAINVGTTEAPEFVTMCTASELGLETEIETKDWYVFCDALQRRLSTGASVVLNGTIKLDVNNEAIANLLGDVHTLIRDGEIAQFNNKLIQFELLTGVQNSVLEYTKYQVATNFTLSDLGGAAEDEGEFSIKMTFNGTAAEITSA